MLVLTETQLHASTSPSPFNVSNYTFYPSFRYKGGLSVYSRLDLPLTRVSDLENANFDVIWLKICISSTTKYLCCLYRSPNALDYDDLFGYLSSTIEHINSSSPFAEVALCGDLNVHHREWLYSRVGDPAGSRAFEFATVNCLQQLIVGPTRIPDSSLQQPSTSPLDLFLSTHVDPYSYTILPPLGKSDHNLISVSAPWTLGPTSNSSNRRLWHYSSAQWDDLRQFYLDFPWDHCQWSHGKSR